MTLLTSNLSTALLLDVIKLNTLSQATDINTVRTSDAKVLHDSVISALTYPLFWLTDRPTHRPTKVSNWQTDRLTGRRRRRQDSLDDWRNRQSYEKLQDGKMNLPYVIRGRGVQTTQNGNLWRSESISGILRSADMSTALVDIRPDSHSYNQMSRIFSSPRPSCCVGWKLTESETLSWMALSSKEFSALLRYGSCCFKT